MKNSREVAQDTAEARGDSTGAVLGLVFHARRCATTGPCDPSGGAAGAVPAVVDVPGLVSPVLKTVEVPQLQYFQGGRVPVVRVQFLCAGVEKTAELPHCSRRALDKVVDMPVCATTTAHGAVQQGCGRPCDHVVGSLAGGASNSVHRQSLWAFSVHRDMGLSAGFGDEG